MKSPDNFKKSYSLLNPKQKQAVDTIDGPVMVVAGPGTGKTQTIALRIANILQKTDTDPDAILALTFTESGAKAMRQRLLEIIGSPAYYVNIFTFHAFCSTIIKDNPDYFNFDPSSEAVSELEKLKLINSIIDNNNFSHIKPAGSIYHYTKSLISSISDLKREAVEPDEFALLLEKEKKDLESSDLSKSKRLKAQRDLDKNEELLKVYRLYQKHLEANQLYDFEDMISEVILALSSHKDLLLDLQERFQYFLVDEFQDSNNAQNQLILMLSSYWGQKANVFVVGDPDQSIYRFQGASIENQLSFLKVFPEASVITLTTNYRSTQPILDSAHSLITNNQLRITDVASGLDPLLKAVSKKTSNINLVNTTTDTAEHIFLATDIRNKLGSGVSPSDIAIIYKTNKESTSIAEVLTKYDIDYIVQGGANILEDPVITNLLTILRVIQELKTKKDDEDLFTILHYDIFDNHPLDVLKISRKASDHKLTLFDVISDAKHLESLDLKSSSNLISTLDLLSTFSKLEANTTFPDFFEKVLNQSGYLKWLLKAKDSHHKITKLNTLFDEIKKMASRDKSLNLSTFLDNINIMNENNLRLEESNYGKNPACITLTTAHSAKGLEWEHVYITKLVNGNWGNTRMPRLINLPDSILTNTNLDKKEKNEDERRLFYVALTRAKSSLTLSYSDSYSYYGAQKHTSPSMFIAELDDALISGVDTSSIEKEAHLHTEKLLTTNDKILDDEKEFLEEIISNFSLSVTALNSYLECPYKFKLDKLLKVPRSKKPHLAFGTAVHKALENLYNDIKEYKPPRKSSLLKYFRQALEKEVLTDKDQEIRLKEGEKILSAYFEYFKHDLQKPLFLEKYFSVVLGDIKLSGKIDRIEWSDKSNRLVRVTDYKTGRPKTKGQIEGTTKDSNGDLRRQLVFYKLLIDLDKRLKNINFDTAVLDFVASPSLYDKSGRYSVKVSAKQTLELESIIKSTMANIRALKFEKTTDYSICKTCDFAPHCWPNGIPVN